MSENGAQEPVDSLMRILEEFRLSQDEKPPDNNVSEMTSRFTFPDLQVHLFLNDFTTTGIHVIYSDACITFSQPKI